MLESSYSHRVLRTMAVDELAREVKKALVNNELVQMREHPQIIFVTKDATEVPPFAHPLKVFESVAIDVRTVTRLDEDGGLVVKSPDEFNFNLLRGELEKVWTDEDRQSGFTTLSQIAGKFFSGYLTEVISKLYTLRADKETALHVVSAYFHWCQYREPIEDVTEHEAKILKYIRLATGLPLEYISPILTEILGVTTSTINDLNRFVGVIIQMPLLNDSLGTLDARAINVATMYNWRGAHSSEIVSLSLEYPPCFIAMLISANEERAFKHTPLERMIQRHRKVDLGQFAKTARALIKE